MLKNMVGMSSDSVLENAFVYGQHRKILYGGSYH